MKRLLPLFLLASAACFAQEPGGEPGDSIATWKVVNFVILAAGLGYLAAKNLPGFFRTRSADIQKEITEAQKLKLESEQRAAAIMQRVSNLAADIEAFRVQARSEMEREGARIREEAAAHIGKLNQQAQTEIESAGKTARRELRTYAGELALDLAGQRIRTRLDANTEAGLVDRFVGDLKRQESTN